MSAKFQKSIQRAKMLSCQTLKLCKLQEFCLPTCLTTTINLPSKPLEVYSLHYFPEQSLFQFTQILWH